MPVCQTILCLNICSKITKIWSCGDAEDQPAYGISSGTLFASIEPHTDITDLAIQQDSGNIDVFHFFYKQGLLFISGEQPKINVYYIPALGPAPKWCCFLDNVTVGPFAILFKHSTLP